MPLLQFLGNWVCPNRHRTCLLGLVPCSTSGMPRTRGELFVLGAWLGGRRGREAAALVRRAWRTRPGGHGRGSGRTAAMAGIRRRLGMTCPADLPGSLPPGARRACFATRTAVAKSSLRRNQPERLRNTSVPASVGHDPAGAYFRQKIMIFIEKCPAVMNFVRR